MKSWFAPTTAGITANQRFTPTASAVPVSVKVPASKNRMRCLLLVKGAAQESVGVLDRSRVRFILPLYPMGYN